MNQNVGSTSVAAVTFNLRYPGQYFDVESGLHYNLNRSYSATLGRYTQSDPIDLQGGWNRFGYAKQNPLGFTDPTGLIVGVDDLVVGGSVLAAGCLMSPGCSGAVGGALSTGVNVIGGAVSSAVQAVVDLCMPGDKWMCEGPGQYDQVGTRKEVTQMGWFEAYGRDEADATYNWKKLVQASAPRGYNARHSRPKRCVKIK